MLHFKLHMKKDYISKLSRVINTLNIKKKDNIYVSGNFINLGIFPIKDYQILPKILFNLLKKKIGPKGTIIVPSHSFYLVNKKDSFDLKKTQSESGAFSNFILKQKKTVRQIHPFSSSAALGFNAKYICSNNSKHVYGPFSPFERMIELKTKFISFGIPINENCSQVHHAEFNMGVPYRYIKEFEKKIKIGKKIYKDKFYLFVLHKEFIKKKRNKNKIIVKNFKSKSKIIKKKFGNNFIYQYSMNNFYYQTINLMKKNIFCWMGSRPKRKSTFEN